MSKGLPSDDARKVVDRLVESYTRKSGSCLHPDPQVTEEVKLGLARNMDEVGKLLCPCRFYPDKREEAA